MWTTLRNMVFILLAGLVAFYAMTIAQAAMQTYGLLTYGGAL